jgi:uncharacterized protein (TIGR02266 family)
VGTINPVRIRLRYADLDTFVEKFAPNVTRGGVFLASRNIQPVGAIIAFEIQLLGGEVVMAGQGKVSWVKDFNPAEPQRPYGMGVQFTSLTPATKVVLTRLLRVKDAGAPVPRGMTAVHATLASMVPSPALNGKPAAPAVDTTVDLAAEYGVDDAAVRRAIDRTRMLVGRADDDLTDLLRSTPVEHPTLALALAGLPRLLDPQSSRRRATGALRPAHPGPQAADAPADSGPISVTPSLDADGSGDEQRDSSRRGPD